MSENELEELLDRLKGVCPDGWDVSIESPHDLEESPSLIVFKDLSNAELQGNAMDTWVIEKIYPLHWIVYEILSDYDYDCVREMYCCGNVFVLYSPYFNEKKVSFASFQSLGTYECLGHGQRRALGKVGDASEFISYLVFSGECEF